MDHCQQSASTWYQVLDFKLDWWLYNVFEIVQSRRFSIVHEFSVVVHLNDFTELIRLQKALGQVKNIPIVHIICPCFQPDEFKGKLKLDHLFGALDLSLHHPCFPNRGISNVILFVHCYELCILDEYHIL